MEILIRGVCSNSGFGIALQGLIKTIQAAGHTVKFIPIDALSIQHRVGFTKSDLDWLDSITINPYKYETSDKILIDVGSLIYGDTIHPIPCRKWIFYCTYETVKIHREYMDMMNNKFDAIWTASNFNKVSFMSSGVNKPVKVLPHYIDFSKFDGEIKPMNISNRRKFNFIYNADLTYRKGIHFLVPAFIEVFDDDEDVALILKLSMSDPKPEEKIVESLNRLLYMKQMLDKQRPPVLIMIKNLPYDQIPSFYQAGQCYVAPNMGEGFALPIAEAMAVGVAPIATRCGAPVDYLDSSCSKFIELDDKMPTVPIRDPWQLKIDPRYQGQSLYHPSYKSLKEQLRWAFDNQEAVETMGKASRAKIREYVSLDRLADIYKELINEVDNNNQSI